MLQKYVCCDDLCHISRLNSDIKIQHNDDKYKPYTRILVE